MNCDSIYEGYQSRNYNAFNDKLIMGERDSELITYIVAILKNYEVTRYIKIKDYEVITDETKIDSSLELRKQLIKRKKKKKNKNKDGIDELVNTIPIDESRYNLFKMTFEINYDDRIAEEEIQLLLPKPYKKYYYRLNGKKLYPIYQIVESTYNNKSGVTMKTLRTPIQVHNSKYTCEDIHGEVHELDTFSIYINRKINPLLYYLASFGLEGALSYLGVDDVINFSPKPIHDEDIFCVRLSTKLYIIADKKWMMADMYTQCVFTMLLGVFKGSRVKEYILDRNYWIRRLGAVFISTPSSQHDKGMAVLASFSISLDDVTKDKLRLNDEDKKDTYALIRWMMQNFEELMLKDNLDINNKRLRITEYIAAELAIKVSESLYRLLSMNSKELSVDKLKSILNIDPMHLIYRIQTSPLLRYDNSVNDMSIWSTLKYTYKGVQSGRIGDEYRNIHPSHIGRFDINSSSNSDPGVSGVLCPMNDMETLYIQNNYWEPDGYRDDAVNRMDDHLRENPSEFMKSNMVENIQNAFSVKDREQIKRGILNLSNLSENVAYQILKDFDNKDKVDIVKKTKANTIKRINLEHPELSEPIIKRFKNNIKPITVVIKRKR